MISITFLGTSSMIPTKRRNQSAVLVRFGTEGILFDCGEGTQRQLKLAGISLTKVTKVLISHWHGDHTLGLPGLLQSLAASESNKKIELYGPAETKKRMKAIFDSFIFDSNNLDISVNEISAGVVFDGAEFQIVSEKLKHGVPIVAYSFVEKDRRKVDMKKVKKFGLKEGPILGELQKGKSILWEGKNIFSDDVTYVVKGKKITYITDTVVCDACYELAKDSDVLICEATYEDKFEEKSHEYGHMTAKQAAMIADKSNVKKLILTHFSARYKNTDVLCAEAKEIFKNTVCAEDFMEVKI